MTATERGMTAMGDQRAIVFGGAGFLGSHVADALSDSGHDVVIFDRKASAYRRDDQEEIVGDILDEDAVSDAVVGRDVVYNFAGIADIEQARDNPVDTVRYNVLGNTVMLEAARRHRVKRFLFASSVYVYSEHGSFYRNSKQACELLIDSYQRVHGLDYTILRYGSLYGPRSDARNGVYRILRQAVEEGRIDHAGTGEEVREYIHVEDAARLSVAALDEEFANEHVVLTGHQAMKVHDLLVMVAEMLGGDVTVNYLPATSEEHYVVTPYTFRPRVGRKLIANSYLDLGQGLLHTVAAVHDALQHEHGE